MANKNIESSLMFLKKVLVFTSSGFVVVFIKKRHLSSTKSLAARITGQLLSCQILDVSIQAVIILIQVNVRLKKKKNKKQ